MSPEFERGRAFRIGMSVRSWVDLDKLEQAECYTLPSFVQPRYRVNLEVVEH